MHLRLEKFGIDYVISQLEHMASFYRNKANELNPGNFSVPYGSKLGSSLVDAKQSMLDIASNFDAVKEYLKSYVTDVDTLESSMSQKGSVGTLSSTVTGSFINKSSGALQNGFYFPSATLFEGVSDVIIDNPLTKESQQNLSSVNINSQLDSQMTSYQNFMERKDVKDLLKRYDLYKYSTAEVKSQKFSKEDIDLMRQINSRNKTIYNTMIDAYINHHDELDKDILKLAMGYYVSNKEVSSALDKYQSYDSSDANQKNFLTLKDIEAITPVLKDVYNSQLNSDSKELEVEAGKLREYEEIERKYYDLNHAVKRGRVSGITDPDLLSYVVKKGDSYELTEDFKKKYSEQKKVVMGLSGLVNSEHYALNHLNEDLLQKTKDYASFQYKIPEVNIKTDTQGKESRQVARYDKSKDPYAFIVNAEKKAGNYNEVSVVGMPNYNLYKNAAYIRDVDPEFEKKYYYASQNGIQQGFDFLKNNEDHINKLTGQKRALEKLKYIRENPNALQGLYDIVQAGSLGLASGLTGYFNNVSHILDNQRVLDASEYENMYLLAALGSQESKIENGWIVKDKNGKYVSASPIIDMTKQYGSALSTDYQLLQTVGNQIPSLLVATATSGLGAGAGISANAANILTKAASLGTMGAGVLGGEYHNSMIEGYSKARSMTNGLAHAALEVVGEKLLGGLPFMGEVPAYNLKTLVKGMAKEGFEEFAQTYFEAGLDYGLKGKGFDLSELISQSFDSAFMGFFSGGIFQANSLVSNAKNIASLHNLALNGEISINEATSILHNQFYDLGYSNEQIMRDMLKLEVSSDGTLRNIGKAANLISRLGNISFVSQLSRKLQTLSGAPVAGIVPHNTNFMYQNSRVSDTQNNTKSHASAVQSLINILDSYLEIEYPQSDVEYKVDPKKYYDYYALQNMAKELNESLHLSKETGKALERIFNNDDYYIGIHRSGSSMGDMILNNGLLITGNQSSGIFDYAANLANNITFFDPSKPSSFLLFLQAIESSSAYKTFDGVGDAVIVLLPKNDFHKDQGAIMQNTAMNTNSSGTPILNSKYILGYLTNDNGNVSNLHFNNQFIGKDLLYDYNQNVSVADLQNQRNDLLNRYPELEGVLRNAEKGYTIQIDSDEAMAAFLQIRNIDKHLKNIEHTNINIDTAMANYFSLDSSAENPMYITLDGNINSSVFLLHKNDLARIILDDRLFADFMNYKSHSDSFDDTPYPILIKGMHEFISEYKSNDLPVDIQKRMNSIEELWNKLELNQFSDFNQFSSDNKLRYKVLTNRYYQLIETHPELIFDYANIDNSSPVKLEYNDLKNRLQQLESNLGNSSASLDSDIPESLLESYLYSDSVRDAYAKDSLYESVFGNISREEFAEAFVSYYLNQLHTNKISNSTGISEDILSHLTDINQLLANNFHKEVHVRLPLNSISMNPELLQYLNPKSVITYNNKEYSPSQAYEYLTSFDESFQDSVKSKVKSINYNRLGVRLNCTIELAPNISYIEDLLSGKRNFDYTEVTRQYQHINNYVKATGNQNYIDAWNEINVKYQQIRVVLDQWQKKFIENPRLFESAMNQLQNAKGKYENVSMGNVHVSVENALMAMQMIENGVWKSSYAQEVFNALLDSFSLSDKSNESAFISLYNAFIDSYNHNNADVLDFMKAVIIAKGCYPNLSIQNNTLSEAYFLANKNFVELGNQSLGIAGTAVHEITHALDYLLDSYRVYNDWKDIKSETKKYVMESKSYQDFVNNLHKLNNECYNQAIEDICREYGKSTEEIISDLAQKYRGIFRKKQLLSTMKKKYGISDEEYENIKNQILLVSSPEVCAKIEFDRIISNRQDYIFRTKYSGYNGMSDMLSGLFDGVKQVDDKTYIDWIYCHDSDYFSKNNHDALEAIADYGSIKLTDPDLINYMRNVFGDNYVDYLERKYQQLMKYNERI